MTNNKPKKLVKVSVPVVDVERVTRAQNRLISLHRRLGSWRAVALRCGVNVRYPYELALSAVVPSNPEIRFKLFLPRVMPSERKPKAMREAMPKVWECPEIYFKKV